jgi:diguanylate cyclase (GGDEF)-like protein/PAS domain S-box-containing protein
MAIKVLLSEDNPDDEVLELRELKRAGLRVEHRLALTAGEFLDALRDFRPHVVISDFSMPKFDGMQALDLAREHAPDVPFIFVSGTLGEDYAIRALKNGATDYVLKSNLVRLPAAVERALASAAEKRARREAEAGLRRAQEMARLAHIVTGPDGAFESWSEALPRLLGAADATIPPTTRAWLDLIHTEDREAFRAASIEAAKTSQRTEVEYRLQRADGRWIHIRQEIEPLGADPARAGRWFSTLQDVTQQREATEAVRRLNRVYAVLSGINTLIVRAEDQDQLFREACEMAVTHGRFPLAWIGMVDAARSRVEIVASAGKTDGYLSEMPLALGTGAPGMVAQAVQLGIAQVANDVSTNDRVILRTIALERGFRSLAILPLVVGGQVVGMMALYAEHARFFDGEEMRLLNELAADIAFAVDHIQKAKRLEFVSNYDPVTGLANRMLMMDRLGQALAATEPGKQVALALLDIERFKAVNDSLGRAAGDALLSRMAERLSALTGDISRVARIGADLFAVIIPRVRSVETVARAIDEGFRRIEGEPFDVAGTALRVAIRSGIALYPADGADADTVFRNAEAALKKAGEQGEKYLFYTQEMTARVAERLSLENRLRLAVEREEFILHYQPKVDVADRRIVGVEALLRWQGPEGLVPPLQFIGLLEETRLIDRVGDWALRRAALDFRAWRDAGVQAPRIAVNVSALQLRNPAFVQDLQRALNGDGAAAGVDLEITESLLMDDIEGTIGKLKAIRAMGAEIAIDDFGTGYSSLAYLARLPVHAPKIDRSFIISMEKDASAMTLVATIISLAHSLRLKVVAEGVETESQAGTLRALGCDAMQGYLVSRPVPADQLVKLLPAASAAA